MRHIIDVYYSIDDIRGRETYEVEAKTRDLAICMSGILLGVSVEAQAQQGGPPWMCKIYDVKPRGEEWQHNEDLIK